MSELNWNIVKTEYFYKNRSSSENTEYLFKNQLEQIKNYIDSLNNTESVSGNSNEIIGIIGERGSGKSSFLGTVSDYLKSDYTVFKTINPTILNVEISIIELFLSEIYKEVINYNTDSKEGYSLNSFNDKLKDYRRIILIKLKEITKMFSNLNSNEEFRKETPSLDVLNNIAETTSLDEALKDLIETFVTYTSQKNKCREKKIVVCIDDLDLVPNNKIYPILEDIQKYLSKNVIVIIAYREQQLYDSVIHKKVQENSILLVQKENYIDKFEIKNQSSKYIEKLIPSSQKIYLPDNSQILNKPIIDFLLPLVEFEKDDDAKKSKIISEFVRGYGLNVDEQELSPITVSKWLYTAIEIKTKIDLKPIDKKEESEYILPNNIRGLFQFIEIIHENMKLIDDTDNDNSPQKIVKDLIGNIQTLKNNLVPLAKERFSEEDQDLYTQWEIADYSSKNYVVYEKLFWRINGSEDKRLNIYSKNNIDNLLRVTEMQTYNISIGDVFSILEEYKKVSENTIEKIYFIYCLKIFYSILLLELYLNAAQEKNKEEEIYLEQYLMLINAKIMPDDFIYFEISKEIIKNNESNNYFGVPYESYYKLINSNEKNERNLNFIEKITYSDVSVGGEVRALNRAKLGYTYTKGKYDIFKYRNFFNYDELDLVAGRQYFYDPFTFMTKKTYVKKSIEQLGIENNYVFYSLFDIDIFVRINYTRQSQQEESDLKYSLRKINRIFNGKFNFNIKNENEIKFLERLSRVVFEANNNKTNDIYTSEDLEFSDVFFESMILSKTSNNKKLTFKKLPKIEYLAHLKKLKKRDDLIKNDFSRLTTIEKRLDIKGQKVKSDDQKFLYDLEKKYNKNGEL